MTLAGMYGISTIHNMALTGNSSFTVDELDQIDYIKKTQTSLFDKWAEQQGAKTYSGQQNHVSEDLLTKIKMNIMRLLETATRWNLYFHPIF